MYVLKMKYIYIFMYVCMYVCIYIYIVMGVFGLQEELVLET